MHAPASSSRPNLDRRRFCRDAALLVVAMAAPRGVASAERVRYEAGALADASYVYIATVRKDGNQSRAVPVWFVTGPRGEILLDTSARSWKAKRIRRGSPVLVWIGARNGPAFLGKAEIVADRAVEDMMIEQIPKRYWLARIGLFAPKRAEFDAGKIVTIRIVRERDLPDGFRSQPGAPAPGPSETGRS
jgi:general stress protein 26